MATEVSRRNVRLADLQNITVTLVTYDDASIGVLSSPFMFNPDARTAALTSGLWTLAAGVVESVAIPSYARGFRLRPSADIRFAISEDPVAAGAESLTVGNTAFANENEVRLLALPASGTLRLLATGATTVQVSFF